MNEDFTNYQFSPVIDYKYSLWFKETQYNSQTLSESERKEFVTTIDEIIAQYTEGLPMMHSVMEEFKHLHGEYYDIFRTVTLVMMFVVITMVDSMVASKYFILADKDYDKRFMRGKLMVILNEGFKRLYGFDKKTHMKSEWDRLLPLMRYFSNKINLQYQEITYLLEKHSKSSPWWKEERDVETHLVTEELYASRQVEIIESKVMMDTMKLFGTLMAVDQFLTNLYACLRNHMVDKLERGEIKAD